MKRDWRMAQNNKEWIHSKAQFLQREVMVTEVLRVEGTRRQPLVSHE